MSYYLLDMSLDKFCLFFERSNSRGMQLNFTDILAAKLYSGFNLRASIEQFESENPHIQANRELIIRAISFFSSDGREVDKGYILKNLRPEHFDQYWNEVCNLYMYVLTFLYENRFMLSQAWLPSENMVLPLIVFFRELAKNGILLDQRQLDFLKLWFWASVFANRYTGASNEVMLEDSRVLSQIAHNKFPKGGTYFRKLRSRLTDAGDILEFQKRASSVYKGLLSIINFDSEQGLLDWTNTSRLALNHDKLHDHHIFPKAFVRKRYAEQPEIQDIVDTVANRVLIPKLTNLKIGARAPSTYLGELLAKNPKLRMSLHSHKIDDDLILNSEFDDMFDEFVEYRAEAIFEIVERVAIRPLENYLPVQESKMPKPNDELLLRRFTKERIPPQFSDYDEVREARVPVFTNYKPRGSTETHVFEGILLLNASYPSRSKIELKDHELPLKPSPAGVLKIRTIIPDFTAVNGWDLWLLLDPRTNEPRSIGDLRSDESLVYACLSAHR